MSRWTNAKNKYLRQQILLNAKYPTNHFLENLPLNLGWFGQMIKVALQGHLVGSVGRTCNS